MGKSRKFSRGPSNGFVPEYRHAVEIMAESEGLGSSGRVDPEMTLSQDSCSRRQKCISINGDSYNQFGVPMQVLPLSKISRSDRKDLEYKLRGELDQVRILQKRVASMDFHGVVKTSSVGSVGKKRPPVQSIAPIHHPSGKKQAFEDRNGSCMKRGVPQNGVLANGVYNAVMKQCEGLLVQLMGHKSGWVFNKPVDVVELNIPDYFTIIKNPMDFGTIKGKFSAGKYSNPLEFAEDVRLTFSNAMIYNPAQNNVHIMAKGLSKYFESRWKTIEKKIPRDVQFPSLEKDTSHMRSSVTDQGPPMKKTKLPPGSGTLKPEPVKKKIPDAINKKMPDAVNKKMPDVFNKKIPDVVNKKMVEAFNKKMTQEEKETLSQQLGSIELPDSIIDLLKHHSSNAEQTADDEIEIDIFSLSEDTLFKLRKLLDDYFTEKMGTKADPPQIELHNEGGSNKSLIQRGKGNDAAEEDIDIGGNDSPILSFPPIEIEKDAAHEILKASSSSSSSSSGSSSSDSDSDSGSSSGSEHEGTKVPNHVNSLKATTIADETSSHRKMKTKDPENRTDFVRAPMDEQNAVTVPPSIEGGGPGGHSEGESAPLEMQVSPEKVYRAALLKSRFADTIFKAQEKTLDKGVQRDPEKLRIEREKLEKMQREEKARLQAAALAAEVARKKADAEAVAEARRKREMEREASRLALQKMEKTVHINENCEFLEHSDNMLGSFKLQSSSNPLEQLGLYMKQDDDEDEDVVDNLSSLTKDVNLEHSESMPDSFKLQLSSNPLEQLGLHMKQDDDEEEDLVADLSGLTKDVNLEHSENIPDNFKLPSSSNSLEQLGLHMKPDDDDEEENFGADLSGLTKDANLKHSENIPDSLKLQSSSNPLEQLGLHMKQDDDQEEDLVADLPGLTKDANLEHPENILDSLNLQSSSNPLEELGLCIKRDDDEQEDVIADSSSSPKDSNLEHSENIPDSSKLQSSSKPLDQLGLCKKQDDNKEEDYVADPSSSIKDPSLEPSENILDSSKLQSSSNPMEQDDEDEQNVADLSNLTKDANLEHSENMLGSLPLEQQGLCMKQDCDKKEDPVAHLSSSTKDTNLELSENILDSSKLQSSSNPLEQPELCMMQDVVRDQPSLIKDADLEQSENMLDSGKLQSSSNLLKQPELCTMQDDVVGDQSSLTKDATPEQSENMLESVQLQSSSNPLEQPVLCMMQEDADKDEVLDVVGDQSSLTKDTNLEPSENILDSSKPPSPSNPLEQPGLPMVQDDEVLDVVGAQSSLAEDANLEPSQNMLDSFKLHSSSKPLDQPGLSMVQDDEILDVGDQSSLAEDANGESCQNTLDSFKPHSPSNQQDDEILDVVCDQSSLTKNVEQSENMVDSLKLQSSSNALQQLGIYGDEDEDVDVVGG